MSVCHNCEKRTATCHSTCREYILEKQQNEIDRKRRLKEKKMNSTGDRLRVIKSIHRSIQRQKANQP